MGSLKLATRQLLRRESDLRLLIGNAPRIPAASGVFATDTSLHTLPIMSTIWSSGDTGS